MPNIFSVSQSMPPAQVFAIANTCAPYGSREKKKGVNREFHALDCVRHFRIYFARPVRSGSCAPHQPCAAFAQFRWKHAQPVERGLFILHAQLPTDATVPRKRCTSPQSVVRRRSARRKKFVAEGLSKKFSAANRRSRANCCRVRANRIAVCASFNTTPPRPAAHPARFPVSFVLQ